MKHLSLFRILLLFSLTFSSLYSVNDPTRPNFLFIIADQYRYDLIKSVQDDMPDYNGKTKVRTPNLDRLRREGVYFKNAYTQCAVCGPARGVFRTGKTLESNGIQSNGLEQYDIYSLDPLYQNKVESNITYEQILAAHKGYVIDHMGKWHLPEFFSYSSALPGAERIIRYNDADFYDMTHDYDYDALIFSFDSDRESFEYSEKLNTMADGLDPVEYPGMQRNTYSGWPYVPDAIDTRFGEAPYSSISPAQPDQQGRNTLPANRTSTYFEGVAAIGALDRLAVEGEPFALTASLHSPHTPMVAAGLYYDYYDALQDNFLLPPSLSGIYETNSAYGTSSDPDYQDPVKVKEWMVSYYALCEEVDVYVGKMLDKLDEHGIADNTLVVFTADHGEKLGAHGGREKGTFNEESAHIPLLARLPNAMPAGLTVEETVTTLDLYATVLDYTNASQYDVGDGKSLRRYIDKTNYNKDYDEEAIVTEWDFRTPDGAGGLHRIFGSETNFLSMKGTWKLMMTKDSSSNRLDMLFNIADDPYEINNLVGNNGMSASDEAIGKAEYLKVLLVEWMQRLDGPGNLYSDPVHNGGEGLGDIQEITIRRKWRTVDIWVSDSEREVGPAVNVSGQWTRNEYFYLGRTNPGTLNVSSITVQGADASRFQLSEFTSGLITEGNYGRLKLTYLPSYEGQPITDARIVIDHNEGADKIIDLSARVEPNTPPQITSLPTKFAEVGDNYVYNLLAIDPDGDSISMSGVSVPTWLTFNSGNGLLTTSLTNAQIGKHEITLRVSDASGSNDQKFYLEVSAAGNDTPVLESTPKTRAIADKPYRHKIKVSDVDGDTLAFTANVIPPWASFDQASGVLSGTPGYTDLGINLVDISVTDGTDTLNLRFGISVFLRPEPTNLIKNSSFEVGNQNPLHWRERPGGEGSNTDARSGSWSAKLEGSGYIAPIEQSNIELLPNTDYNISMWANGAGITAGHVVFDTNNDFDGSGQGQFSIHAGDTSGWTQFSGSFNSGQTTVTKIRMYAEATFSGLVYFDDIVISPASGGGNEAPQISSIPQSYALINQNYQYSVLAADPEGDAITITADLLPSWLTYDALSGLISGTPSAGHTGSHQVELSVNDGDKSGTQIFQIEVTSSVPDMPVIVTSPIVTDILEGDLYRYTFSAIDPDGDVLTYSAPVKPAWLNIDSQTGVLSGTPGQFDIGSHSLSLSVSDGTNVLQQNFTVNVLNPGRPVVSFITPADNVLLNVGDNLYVDVGAVDPDGIDRVRLYKDGIELARSEGSAPYTWNGGGSDTELANLQEGTFVLTGRAMDDLGFEGEASITVHVGSVPGTIPLVNFITPAGNVNLNVGDNLAVEVAATDPDGIDRVRLYLDGLEFTRSEGTAPYNWSGAGDPELANFQEGVYILTARATDDVGDVGETSITITVGNAQANMIQNGSFETGSISPWTASSAAESYVSTELTSDGNYGLKMAPEADGYIPPTKQNVNVIENSDYTLSYAVNRPLATAGSVTVRVNPGLVYKKTYHNATSGWENVEVTFNSGSATTLSIEIYADGGFADIAYFDNFVLAPKVSTPFEDWKTTHNVVDDLGDDDNDGILNILEFALSSDPNLEDAGDNSPSVAKNGSNFDFTFRRGEQSIEYTVEKSTDMITWVDHVVINDSHGTVGSDITISLSESEMSSGLLFLRLRVAQN